ncbi:hypothetical protein FSP39_000121, partial [Pinctada imbricata]
NSKAMDFLRSNDIDVILGSCQNLVITVSEKTSIPYICTTSTRKKNLSSVFQLLPQLLDFSHAIFDVVRRFGWKEVTLFYDDDKGLQILEDLLTNHDLIVKSWKVGESDSADDQEANIRQYLVYMRRAHIQKVILVCNSYNTRLVFHQAWHLAMMSSPYEWIVYDPGLDFRTHYTGYPNLVVNITSLALFNHLSFGTSTRPSLERSLLLDSVSLIEKAVSQSGYTSYDRNLAILQNLRHMQTDGKSGFIKFDSGGKRINYTIHLMGFDGNKTYNASTWKALDGNPNRLSITHEFREQSVPFPLQGRVISAVMILESPFTMLKSGHENRTGNDKYEGYCVDLLSEVANKLNFKYQIYLVHDRKFGSRQKNGEWNGIIGELLVGNATMSVAPLSINAERESAVDFTKPFMTRYISVLMKVPETESSYFEFLYPLSVQVYVFTLIAFMVVGIVLYLLEKYGITRGKINSVISFQESLWFVFGSLLQGSTDAAPMTTPGRILTSAWWFFVLILVSSYTANLAAFLTVKKINTPIKTVMDLSSQSKVKFGTVKNSAVTLFFTRTEIESFRLMGEQMLEVDPGSMVETSEQGFRKVNEEKYAFFWDSTVNRYMTTKNCNLVEIGPPFGPRGFGIGTPPGATYLEGLSMAILQLSDTGVLNMLENKWWGPKDCPSHLDSSADDANELQIDKLAGIFFVLSGGIIFAVIISLFEFVIRQNEKMRKFFRIQARCDSNRRHIDAEFETGRKLCSDNGIDT